MFYLFGVQESWRAATSQHHALARHFQEQIYSATWPFFAFSVLHGFALIRRGERPQEVRLELHLDYSIPALLLSNYTGKACEEITTLNWITSDKEHLIIFRWFLTRHIQTIILNNDWMWINESKYLQSNTYNGFLYPVAVRCSVFLGSTSHSLTSFFFHKAKNILLFLPWSFQSQTMWDHRQEFPCL